MRNRLRLGLVPLMAAALWLAGCSDQSLPSGELFGPQQAQFNQGNANGLSRYKKVLATPPSGQLVDEQWVHGGNAVLRAGGYELLIPGGAVTKNTKFRMEAMTDGSIGVKLTATQIDNKGQEIDVGTKGFRKPVTLTLYYDRAAEEITDPSKLTILWVQQSGQLVAQKSYVVPQYKRVFTDLQHFSDYILGVP